MSAEEAMLAIATLVQLFDENFLLRESIGRRGDGCKQAAHETTVLRVVVQMVDQPLLLSDNRRRLSNKRFCKLKKFMVGNIHVILHRSAQQITEACSRSSG
jgi:hypothetical protein